MTKTMDPGQRWLRHLAKEWFLLGMLAAVILASLFPEAGAHGGILHAETTTNLGIALVNGGRAEEGVAEFRKIVEADPANNVARVNIGFAHLQKGELPEAEVDFRDVIRRDATSAIAHYDWA